MECHQASKLVEMLVYETLRTTWQKSSLRSPVGPRTTPTPTEKGILRHRLYPLYRKFDTLEQSEVPELAKFPEQNVEHHVIITSIVPCAENSFERSQA